LRLVVRLVAVVAAVCPELLAVGVLLADALVLPVPDEPAVEVRQRFDLVPVILQIACAVAYSKQESF